MRVAFDNVTHPSRVAKSLRKSLLSRGLDIPLSRCQETLARMTGHADWHELAAVAASGQQAAVPDALATATVRGARVRQYVAALRDASVPEPVAHAVLRDASPTASRLVPGQGADVAFIHAAHPALADVDLSPAAIANLPGLLNLLRRTHHAASVEPFWAARSSFTALGLVDPAAAALLSGMRRTIAHSWWGPSIVLALLRMSDANDEATIGRERTNPAVRAFLDGGVEAMSAELAAMEPVEVFSLVGKLVETCGVAALLAALEAGGIRGVDPTARAMGTDVFRWVRAAPWREPRPFSLQPFGTPVWSRIPLDEITSWHHDCYELFDKMYTEHDRYEVMAATSPDDPHVAALLGLLRESQREGLASEARHPGTVVLVLGKRRGEAVTPLGAVAVSKAADVVGGVETVTVGRLYVAGRSVAPVRKLLLVAIAQAVHADADEWGKVLVPGTPVVVALRPSREAGDRRLLGELREALRHKAILDSDMDAHPIMVPVMAEDVAGLGIGGFEATEQERELLARLTLLRLAKHHQGCNVVAVQPFGGTCKVLYDRGSGHLDKAGFPSGLADPALASRLIGELGKRAGLDRPVILLGALGTPFLAERKDVRGMLYGFSDCAAFLVPGVGEPGERERADFLTVCRYY